jgi:hypothetical protein
MIPATPTATMIKARARIIAVFFDFVLVFFLVAMVYSPPFYNVIEAYQTVMEFL